MTGRFFRAAAVWTGIGAGILPAQDLTVVVNGTPVVTALPGIRAGGEYYVCGAPIARALGADLTMAVDGLVQIRRADGAEITYDVRAGEIRTGSLLLGRLKANAAIQRGSGIDHLLLPVSALVPILEVSVRRDEDKNILFVESAGAGGGARGATGLQIADLNYAYGLTTNGSYAAHNFYLGGEALDGGVTLSTAAQVTRSPQTPVAYLNHAHVRADWGSNRSMTLGDQAVLGGIEPLTNSLRGASYQQSLGSWKGAVFGGKAIGSTAASAPAGGPRHETDMAGVSMARGGDAGAFSFGASGFRNTERQGLATGGAYRARSVRNHFSVQGAAGEFSGSPTGSVIAGSRSVRGFGYGFSVADSYTPSRLVSVTAEWERYSPRFLTSRPDTRYNAASAASVSVSLRPLQSISVTGSASDRSFTLREQQRTRSYSVSANLTIPGQRAPQIGYARSSQSGTGQAIPSFVLSQYSVIFAGSGRYSANVYYAQTRLGRDRYSTANASGALDLRRYGRIGAQFQQQSAASQRIGADWNGRLGEAGAYLRLGADRIVVAGRAQLAPVAAARVPALWGQWLEVSYRRDFNTQFLQAQLSGRMARKREVTRDSRGVARIVPRASIAGRVCVDENYNGVCDGGDRPLADLKVWRGEGANTRTDAAGWYRFDEATAGAHAIRVELAGVPAGFVFDGPGEHTINAQPGVANRQDFRVIRTGQVEGKVLYTDYSVDADHPTEAAYPDARILATGDRDTYSEANGFYLLGDLPPGSYELRVDPATFPKGYVAVPASRTVQVQPGATARIEPFKLVIPPKPVIEIRAPAQVIGPPRAGR